MSAKWDYKISITTTKAHHTKVKGTKIYLGGQEKKEVEEEEKEEEKEEVKN